MAFIYARESGRLRIPDHLLDNPSIEWERSSNEPVQPPRSSSDIVAWVLCEGDSADSAFLEARELAEDTASCLEVR